MDIRHITKDQYLRQPWKNGGGTTTELLKEMVDGEVLWRLSIASVEQSGPFSNFSGFDRTIMLLKGNGMMLSFDCSPEKRIDRRLVPFVFAGEWKTDCQLIDGPVEDFNLMVDRRRAKGQLQVHELSGSLVSHELQGDTSVFHCLEGNAEVAVGEHCVALRTGETLRVDRGTGELIATRAIDLPCSLAMVGITRL